MAPTTTAAEEIRRAKVALIKARVELRQIATETMQTFARLASIAESERVRLLAAARVARAGITIAEAR